VLYSGTVAAAMEGLALGIPSIAISFAGGDLRADVTMLDRQVETLTWLLAHLTSLPEFPQDTLLNVNLPPLPSGEIKGARLTSLGRRAYSDSLQPMKDPWGRQIYWIGGGQAEWRGDEQSDFRAINDGYISITPLHLDLTHHRLLKDPGNWWRDL
jgi:5'-nucleotidase